LSELGTLLGALLQQSDLAGMIEFVLHDATEHVVEVVVVLGLARNLFRQARFLSAVDFVQADRLRRKVALEMARIFKDVDVFVVPSLRDEQLTITNFTGHPSLTLRAGFIDVSEARSDWAPDPANPLPKFAPPRRVPHGITIVGRLFEDGLVGQVGLALERAFGVAGKTPAGF